MADTNAMPDSMCPECYLMAPAKGARFVVDPAGDPAELILLVEYSCCSVIWYQRQWLPKREAADA